jgi:hypothetical protein
MVLAVGGDADAERVAVQRLGALQIPEGHEDDSEVGHAERDAGMIGTQRVASLLEILPENRRGRGEVPRW